MLRVVKWLSPPGYQVSVINASGCGNEREEDLKERKWVVRNGWGKNLPLLPSCRRHMLPHVWQQYGLFSGKFWWFISLRGCNNFLLMNELVRLRSFIHLQRLGYLLFVPAASKLFLTRSFWRRWWPRRTRRRHRFLPTSSTATAKAAPTTSSCQVSAMLNFSSFNILMNLVYLNWPQP